MAVLNQFTSVDPLHIGTLVGSLSPEIPVLEAVQDLKVTKASILPGGAVATGTSGTLTLYNRGTTGSGTTAIATRGTSGNPMVQNVAWDLTLTAANAKVTTGQMVTLRLTQGSVETQVVNATLQLQYQRMYY